MRLLDIYMNWYSVCQKKRGEDVKSKQKEMFEPLFDFDALVSSLAMSESTLAANSDKAYAKKKEKTFASYCTCSFLTSLNFFSPSFDKLICSRNEWRRTAKEIEWRKRRIWKRKRGRRREIKGSKTCFQMMLFVTFAKMIFALVWLWSFFCVCMYDYSSYMLI